MLLFMEAWSKMSAMYIPPYKFDISQFRFDGTPLHFISILGYYIATNVYTCNNSIAVVALSCHVENLAFGLMKLGKYKWKFLSDMKFSRKIVIEKDLSGTNAGL